MSVRSMVALIPARAGSQRLPWKNLRPLHGRPLLAYSIHAALASGLFSTVLVSTDCTLTEVLGKLYGAHVRLIGPPCHTHDCCDITWVRDALQSLPERPDAFAILRPSSPFRTAETIRRCYRQFTAADETCDSIRAVEPVSQHPGKMWTWQGDGYPIKPVLPQTHPDGTPWHSSPTQSLPKYFVQNACLEMGYTSNVEVHGTISGRKIIPFFTTGYEGHDVNTFDDWERAARLVAEGHVTLPRLDVAPLSATPETLQQADPGGAVSRGSRL